MKKAMEILIQEADLPDDAAADMPDIYPAWTPGAAYVKDNIVRYDGVLYRVKSTVAAADKTPDRDNSSYQVVKSK